ncbi:MAG: hypothetical protein ACMG6H_12395 [Acidobacteriota bacterium]
MTLRQTPGQLPIWRDANALLPEVEQAVRRFSRYHKYSLGAELMARPPGTRTSEQRGRGSACTTPD